jgi:hypothetical protein
VVDSLVINIPDEGFVNLGSDLIIKKCLNLVKGHLNIGSNFLDIGEAGTISEGRTSSYIITSGNGFLAIPMRAGAAKPTIFPLGTRNHYFPASVRLNKGSSDGLILMRVCPATDSLRNSYGIVSPAKPSIDALFFVQSDISSNINMNLQISWSDTLAGNGLIPNNAEISNYAAGKWDMGNSSAAMPAEGGMYNLMRKNITSLGLFSVFEKSVIPNVQRISDDGGFKLVFNPVVDYICITNKTGAGREINVRITDMNGRLITTFTCNKATSGFSLIGIKPGDYFAELYNDQINIVKKFTKSTMQSMISPEYRALKTSDKSLKGMPLAENVK